MRFICLKNKKISVLGKEIEIKVVDKNATLYEIIGFVNNILYHIKKVFVPWNQVRLHQIPNEYYDRDYIMFHAIFQILVDFVELEHDFVPWDIRKTCTGRFTDINVMHNYLKHQITPEGLETYYSAWDTDTHKAKIKHDIEQSIKIKLEILYLYSWYKFKAYEFDSELILHVDLSHIHCRLFKDEDYINDNQILLTSQEHTEAEQEHELKCDNMLKRVLAVRHYLWT